ncbi:MAG: hypothetical protein ACI4TM_11090 [Candidatus Cryptobacteroides sp.]
MDNRIVNRNIHIRLFSAMVALWYVLCVSGFDVHTCRHTGDSVVRLLAEGIECSDVHPDEHCHSCTHSCSHDCGKEDRTGEELENDNSCCFNEISVLIVPGISAREDQHNNHHHTVCLCGHCPLADVVEFSLPDIYRGFIRPVRILVPSDPVGTMLSKTCFWRI